jgi:hypothetical protein
VSLRRGGGGEERRRRPGAVREARGGDGEVRVSGCRGGAASVISPEYRGCSRGGGSTDGGW